MSHHGTPANGPVEEKVKWATVASYAGALILTAVANAFSSEDSALVLGALPEWLESIVLPLLPALATFLAGWSARHTHRPDLHRGGTNYPAQ